MRVRSVLLGLGSLIVGNALLRLLLVISRVDLCGIFQRVRSVDTLSFVDLSLLVGVNIYLSTQKWQIMDRVLRHRTDPELPAFTAFAVTSAGNLLGQFLPVQLSMVVARTLGTWTRGRALRRGTVGTLIEQGFDVLTICFLMMASAGTRLLRGDAALWFLLAILAALLALGPVGAMAGWLRRVRIDPVISPHKRLDRLKRSLLQLQESGLLEASVARRLMALSFARFGVLVLMAGQITTAIRADVPVWHLAAAMPFVVFSNAVAITPGGLGITELTYAAALNLFGTPVATGAAWALANRFLVIAATFAVAIPAIGLFFALCLWHRARNASGKIAASQQES